MEGSEMHHCVFTCYWDRIKDYEYLAFAFDVPARFTLGLDRKMANGYMSILFCVCLHRKCARNDFIGIGRTKTITKKNTDGAGTAVRR